MIAALKELSQGVLSNCDFPCLVTSVISCNSYCIITVVFDHDIVFFSTTCFESNCIEEGIV